MLQSVLTSRASLDRSACPLLRRIPKPCEDMGRHENIAPGPSWTVVIFAQPSPLVHTVTASGFCTAPGRVIGHISPYPHNGRILLVILLQSSSSAFSRGNLLSFLAFKKGMLGTPISVLGGWPTVSGRFLHGPRRKMLYISKMYLSVQCWVAGKGGNPCHCERMFFHMRLFEAFGLVLQQGPPPLPSITML